MERGVYVFISVSRRRRRKDIFQEEPSYSSLFRYFILFFFLPSRNSQIAKNRWMYCSSPSAAAAVQRKIIDWWSPRLLGLLFFLFFQGSRGSISGWVRTGGYGPLFFFKLFSSRVFVFSFSWFSSFFVWWFAYTDTKYKESQITAATAPVRPNIHPALAKCQFKCPSSL
jgi:hypothetical protein